MDEQEKNLETEADTTEEVAAPAPTETDVAEEEEKEVI